MTEKNEELIETFDEDGNKVVFEMLDIVTVDDIEYALLLPKCGEHCNCEKHNHEDDPEVLVMRLKKDGEEYSFEEIEDDNEFNKVAEYIEKIEDEIEE
ncbi:MAG: DUF1292 domain-containing protein [Candidatus Gastranaerophilales bacterium]|nr:DUF1292 domain-containing protein [Candidatus Gastranaerophilales bacterium]